MEPDNVEFLLGRLPFDEVREVRETAEEEKGEREIGESEIGSVERPLDCCEYSSKKEEVPLVLVLELAPF